MVRCNAALGSHHLHPSGPGHLNALKDHRCHHTSYASPFLDAQPRPPTTNWNTRRRGPNGALQDIRFEVESYWTHSSQLLAGFCCPFGQETAEISPSEEMETSGVVIFVTQEKAQCHQFSILKTRFLRLAAETVQRPANNQRLEGLCVEQHHL